MNVHKNARLTVHSRRVLVRRVLVEGQAAADGTVTAGSISVGKDGLVPPM